MGVDLHLLPCEAWSNENDRVWGFSHTVLNLGRVGSGVYEEFKIMVEPHLMSMPDGHNVSSFIGARVPDGTHKGEPTYGTIRPKDAYGAPYTYVCARHLLPWLRAHFNGNGGTYRSAIVAYVQTLPSDTKIVLDWH